MNPSQNPSALRSKKIITEILLQLMKQYSYNEITVKQIILESAVSRKTFYRNFLSKDDVLNSYIDTILSQYVKAINEQGEYSIIRIPDILDIIFSFCEENRDLLLMLRTNELLYLFLMRLNHVLPAEHKKIVRHNQETDYKQHLSQYIISFNIGGVWNTIVEWIENDMRDNSIDIKDAIIYYLSNIKSIDLRDI